MQEVSKESSCSGLYQCDDALWSLESEITCAQLAARWHRESAVPLVLLYFYVASIVNIFCSVFLLRGECGVLFSGLEIKMENAVGQKKNENIPNVRRKA